MRWWWIKGKGKERCFWDSEILEKKEKFEKLGRKNPRTLVATPTCVESPTMRLHLTVDHGRVTQLWFFFFFLTQKWRFIFLWHLVTFVIPNSFLVLSSWYHSALLLWESFSHIQRLVNYTVTVARWLGSGRENNSHFYLNFGFKLIKLFGV